MVVQFRGLHRRLHPGHRVSFVLGVYLLLLAEWVITAIVDYPEINLTPIFVLAGFILALFLFVSFYIAARQAGKLDQKW